jgi:hypothetical protein
MMVTGDAPSPSAVRKSRALLIGLAALFIAPLLAAWLVLRAPGWWGLTATANHGDLIQPARPLADFSLAADEGPITLEDLRGKWTVVQFAGAGCGEVCRETLYKTRQTRLVLHRERIRVQRLLVLDGPAAARTADLLAAEHPHLLVGTAAPAVLRSLAEQFAEAGQPPVPEAHRIYIVDPLGNLMMGYGPDFEMAGLKKDLKRLLKASHVG